jgi:hypothetical protein
MTTHIDSVLLSLWCHPERRRLRMPVVEVSGRQSLVSLSYCEKTLLFPKTAIRYFVDRFAW